VYAEYNLGRRGSRLTATLGITDTAPSDSTAYVTIYGDDRVLGSPYTIRSGAPKPIRLNVDGVLHLKFMCSPKVGQEGRFRLALGDATVASL
jgi:hypothetical protein